MGCGCTKTGGVDNPQRRLDEQLARKLQAEEHRAYDSSSAHAYGGRNSNAHAHGGRGNRPGQDWGANGGRQLGGAAAGAGGANLSAEERKQRALEAAERRQNNVPGMSGRQADTMRDNQQKSELLGRIAEHYNKKKMDIPMGLNAASVEQLRKHLDHIRENNPTDQLLN